MFDFGLTLAKDMELQVLSLGCGLDTSYYNERANEKEERRYRYVEIDLQEVAKKKVNEVDIMCRLPKYRNRRRLKHC